MLSGPLHEKFQSTRIDLDSISPFALHLHDLSAWDKISSCDMNVVVTSQVAENLSVILSRLTVLNVFFYSLKTSQQILHSTIRNDHSLSYQMSLESNISYTDSHLYVRSYIALCCCSCI